MSIRDEQAHQAAMQYYLQGQTMESIAKQLEISRASVSRLLTHARETGLVRITVAPPSRTRGALATQFKELFGINAWVVPVRQSDTNVSRTRSVSRVAAECLVDLLEPNFILGIAWGNTTAAVTEELPHIQFPGLTVVQLNGAANALVSGIPYAQAIVSQAAFAFGASTLTFPVPAFFDSAETKAAMWQERSVKAVLETIERCDVALFSVGVMDGAMPSHVYSGGFMDQEEIEGARADGVVGDVCTVLLREDGSTNMELNARATGPSPQQLRKIPRRLCVVAGDSKLSPLLGALRAGVMTDLVIDSSLASLVLNRLKGPRATVRRPREPRWNS